jgi:hypothetical protein
MSTEAKIKKMWDQFEHTFQQADKTWELANDVFKAAQSEVKAETFNTKYPDAKDSHTLRFKAESMSERRRLFWRFFKMAWQALWSGKTQFQFRVKR